MRAYRRYRTASNFLFLLILLAILADAVVGARFDVPWSQYVVQILFAVFGLALPFSRIVDPNITLELMRGLHWPASARRVFLGEGNWDQISGWNKTWVELGVLMGFLVGVAALFMTGIQLVYH